MVKPGRIKGKPLHFYYGFANSKRNNLRISDKYKANLFCCNLHSNNTDKSVLCCKVLKISAVRDKNLFKTNFILENCLRAIF